MVVISCPHCSKALNVTPEKLGKRGRCPQCREAFTVAVTTLAKITASEDSPSPLLAVRETALKTSQAIGSGLVKMGGAALEWNKSRLDVRDRKQQEIAKREQERLAAELAENASPIPCPFCSEPIAREARKCRHCNEYLDVSLRPGTHAHPPQIIINNTSTNTNTVQSVASAYAGQNARKRFSRIAAFLLSLLIPGLGQLYTGRLLFGIGWFVFVAIGYVFIIPGLVLHFLCACSAAMADPYN